MIACNRAAMVVGYAVAIALAVHIGWINWECRR